MHDDLLIPANEVVAVSQALLSEQHGNLSQSQRDFLCMIRDAAEHFVVYVYQMSDIIVSMKAGGELVNVSHELRTPLTSIRGFSQLCLSGVEGALNDWQREQFEQINLKGTFLSERVSDIFRGTKGYGIYPLD
ncbi:MAG: histidine kinase dimerization/phospho-acceptor domain-containing protein [Anaerolineae bacterium]